MTTQTQRPPAAGEISGGSPTGAEVRVTGRRILAHVADAFLLGFLFVVLIGVHGAAWDHQDPGFGTEAGVAIGILPVLGFCAVAVLYYVSFEGYVGQTIGKMLFGIRVVREGDGREPGTKAALIRTLLRPLDGAFFHLVGFAAVLVSGKRQRVGDMAARTLVVRG